MKSKGAVKKTQLQTNKQVFSPNLILFNKQTVKGMPKCLTTSKNCLREQIRIINLVPMASFLGMIESVLTREKKGPGTGRSNTHSHWLLEINNCVKKI